MGRSSAHWTCWRYAGRDGGSRPGGALHPAPLPHALRGGVRHLAVRRGVAAGGDGVLVPAAARGARAPRRAGRARNRHRRGHAGAGGPARAARRGGALSGVHARHPPGVPQRGRRGPRARGAGTRPPRPCASQPPTTSGRRRTSSAAAATSWERCEPCGTVARSICGRRAPRTRCCPCWRRTTACGCRSRPGWRLTPGASSRGKAASGCPSAPTGRASRTTSPGPECRPSASTRRALPIPSTTSSRSRRGGRSPSRSTGAPLRWCGTTAATPRTPCTGTTTRRRSTGCGPGRTGANPTTATSPTAGRASMPRTSWSRSCFAPTPTGPRGGGPPSWFARSTPSCSATGGTRGRCGSTR